MMPSFFGLTGKSSQQQAAPTKAALLPAAVAPSPLTAQLLSMNNFAGFGIEEKYRVSAIASGASAPGTYIPAKGQDYKPHYYPPMPHGCESPSTLPSLLTIRQLECPPPSRSLAEQKTDVVGGTIEGKLCRNITLTKVEIKSSYLVNCTLINCISKGCYFTSTRMIATDIVNAPCVISCHLEDSFISLSILSNCRMIQGAVKESRVMDSDFEAAGVFYCRLTRSLFYQCEYREIEQLDCELRECDGNGDVDAFFPIVVPQQQIVVAQQQQQQHQLQMMPATTTLQQQPLMMKVSVNSPLVNTTITTTPQLQQHIDNNNSCNSNQALGRAQSHANGIPAAQSTFSTPLTAINGSSANVSHNNSPAAREHLTNSNNNGGGGSSPNQHQRPAVPVFVQQQYVQPPSFLSQLNNNGGAVNTNNAATIMMVPQQQQQQVKVGVNPQGGNFYGFVPMMPPPNFINNNSNVASPLLMGQTQQQQRHADPNAVGTEATTAFTNKQGYSNNAAATTAAFGSVVDHNTSATPIFGGVRQPTAQSEDDGKIDSRSRRGSGLFCCP